MEEKLTNFVTFPRKITGEYRNGSLTKDELFVYMWVRLNANPYGIAITSFSDIKNDLFKGRTSENYINKIFISLKKKRYIYYTRRSGRRGSFEVHFDEWILPTKKVRTLDKFFNLEDVRGLDSIEEEHKEEESQNLGSGSQRIDEIKSDINTLVSSLSSGKQVRASHNDKNNNKNNDINRKEIVSNKEEILVSSFKPSSYNEEQCLKIALELGEKNMNYLLGIKSKHGFSLISSAWSRFKEDSVGKQIGNKPAYFNGIVKNLVEGISNDLGY